MCAELCLSHGHSGTTGRCENALACRGPPFLSQPQKHAQSGGRQAPGATACGLAAGITLSPKQVERGGQLAAERGLTNVDFRVMNALAMEFPDDSFDLVWACESGEHMPDKKAYVEEMVRVLKPGRVRARAPLRRVSWLLWQYVLV